MRFGSVFVWLRGFVVDILVLLFSNEDPILARRTLRFVLAKYGGFV